MASIDNGSFLNREKAFFLPIHIVMFNYLALLPRVGFVLVEKWRTHQPQRTLSSTPSLKKCPPPFGVVNEQHQQRHRVPRSKFRFCPPFSVCSSAPFSTVSFDSASRDGGRDVRFQVFLFSFLFVMWAHNSFNVSRGSSTLSLHLFFF